MKNKLICFISLLLVCSTSNILAQDPNELILQMSQNYSGGTARMMGLGGGKVSLGADAGNIYLNPAGLGFYNRSEIVFTPQIDYTFTGTEYLNETSAGYKLNFNIANLGFVFNNSEDIAEGSKWRGGSFAFTFNRINDFHFNADYLGYNTSQDIIDYAVEQDNFYGQTDLTDLIFNADLTGVFYDIYESGQEFVTINGFDYRVDEIYGTNVQPGDTLFFVDRNIYRDGNLAFPSDEFPTLQKEEIRSRGSQYAASFSYGGNYNDRLYFGIGLNLMSVDKQVERTYIEQPSNADLNRLILTDNYDLNGSGINATFGLIGRPVNNILLGLSYTTPTYYALEEIQELELIAEYNTGTENDFLVTEPFFYDLNMPSRIRGGITYFFGKNGFISADVESMKTKNSQILNSDDFDFQNETNRITRENFDQTVSIGIGGEYRFDIFRARAGFNYITDPTEADGVDFDRYLYSLGVGLRKEHFFLDIAYTGNQYTQLFRPYPTATAAEASLYNNYITTSIGFTF